jgi:hypothetical protein
VSPFAPAAIHAATAAVRYFESAAPPMGISGFMSPLMYFRIRFRSVACFESGAALTAFREPFEGGAIEAGAERVRLVTTMTPARQDGANVPEITGRRVRSDASDGHTESRQQG